MADLVTDAVSGALLAEALDAGTPTALVCHGLAALLAATREDGALAAAGRTVAAFTEAEERQAGLGERAPWLLETALRDRGVVVDAAEPWADHVVVDGPLVTGQNPQSSPQTSASA